jgi:hypothetical protein
LTTPSVTVITKGQEKATQLLSAQPAGVPLADVREILGHASDARIYEYAQVEPERIAESPQRFPEHMRRMNWKGEASAPAHTSRLPPTTPDEGLASGCRRSRRTKAGSGPINCSFSDGSMGPVGSKMISY